MKVLVIGGGGREAAIAWSCEREGHDVTVAATLPDTIGADGTDLVIPGPEAALVDGVADRCAEAGVPCFGPTAALARLESSKGFTRALAAQLGLPSPAYVRTESVADALQWWHELGSPVVVKLDGLAAGKGVIVPASPAATEAAIVQLAGRGPIVLEERLHGPECSLMALCDGRVARPLPLAQDHKRIGEGDSGPNTGGMGAYAPAPVPYSAEELCARFVQPVLDHLRAAGTPYVGVLYAGLMLTPTGPRLLEFNCRFGDPEAQAVLPLLDGNLAEIALACCEGRLDDVPMAWSCGASCTVVAAAPGYPGDLQLGAPIVDLADIVPDDIDQPRAIVFPASTDGERVTGGRVLAVTGLGADLAEARANAYERLDEISFDGMQVRRDIGWRALGAGLGSYADTGVDIDEGVRAVEQMRAAVESTHGPAVLQGVGSFGGAFSAKALATMQHPVLVASTDGVGTKVELAARLGRYRGIGADIVNHCVNDVLVQGARPLFFLDYVAASRIDASRIAEIVGGMGEACAAVDCRAARRGDRRDARRLRRRRVRHRRHPDRRRRARRTAPPPRPSPR
ncbi:MAG: phosphoribosylamine--glycine ligase [Ilumatobacteraceae bacterium]